jgi:hypothetical protein
VFPSVFGVAVINRILEPLFFCYLPAFITFCFLSKKDTSFYFKIYKKIPYLFRFFLRCSKCEVYFYKDPPLGYLVLTASLIFYLFLLYTDSFFVHLRIPLIYCYASFCVFLRQNILETQNTILPKYKEFCKIQKELKKEEIVNGRIILSLSYSLVGYILYRQNSIMSEHLLLMENFCNTLLQLISEKITESTDSDVKQSFQEIQNKKIDVFNSYKKKLFLYKASLLLFNWRIEPYGQIYHEIISFYNKLL